MTNLLNAKLSPAELLGLQSGRYAVKRFDPLRLIPVDLWSALEESLRLSPSSYGLQPWQFLVVQDRDLRKKLRAVSWGQSQVEDASHYVVFLANETMTVEHVNLWIRELAQARGVSEESLAGFRKGVISDVIDGPRAAWAKEWMARQCYIALGNLMTSAALLGVDTCPMEGLDPDRYDEILGLRGSGLRTVVACAVGYRHADDKYQHLPKARFSKSRIIKYV